MTPLGWLFTPLAPLGGGLFTPLAPLEEQFTPLALTPLAVHAFWKGSGKELMPMTPLDGEEPHLRPFEGPLLP